jgi:hypothetical protein
MAEVPAYMLQGVPVLQPPHLEGLSDSSLSTEILPGPPSLLSIQQAAHKRDPKKPSGFVSYLPTSDPGSTYSGLMTASLGGSEVDGPRRKRVRVDKGYVRLSLRHAMLPDCTTFVHQPKPNPSRCTNNVLIRFAPTVATRSGLQTGVLKEQVLET